MSETLTTEQEVTTVVQPAAANPFEEGSWAETPIVEQPDGTVEAPKETSQAPVQEEKKVEEEILLEPNEWLKNEFGWDTAEKAKQEIAELRKQKEIAQTPAQIKFANEQSEKFFEALKEGKEDDIYSYLNQKRQLERLDKLELKSISEAAEIIKANLQFKHKDLTQEEVNFLYNKRYSFPAKPKQGEDQDDADFAIEMEAWQNNVKEKEQEMIIEAKLARPDLAKYKSELVLPDIPKKETQTQEPEIDQKLLAQRMELREMVLRKLDSDFSNFKGWDTTVKDELVELPISFIVPEAEKVAIKEQLKDFDINAYIDEVWFDKEGNPKVPQMIEDMYLLQNRKKVFQGIANDAASKRLEAKLKEISNIKINPAPQGTFTPQNGKSEFDNLAAQVWNNPA